MTTVQELGQRISSVRKALTEACDGLSIGEEVTLLCNIGCDIEAAIEARKHLLPTSDGNVH